MLLLNLFALVEFLEQIHLESLQVLLVDNRCGVRHVISNQRALCEDIFKEAQLFLEQRVLSGETCILLAYTLEPLLQVVNLILELLLVVSLAHARPHCALSVLHPPIANLRQKGQ